MRQNTPADSITPRTGPLPADGFEGILPPEALDELLRRGRPPSPPIRPPTLFIPFRSAPGVRGIVLALLGLALVVAVIVASAWHQPSQPSNVVAPAPVAQPTPALPSNWNADGTAVGRAGVIPEVRRAELAPPVVRRAELVRLPAASLSLNRVTAIAPENIDQTHVITMPYGTEVSATLRGFLNAENQLPRAGHIGDMYIVGTVPWIWIRVSGTSAPTWVDP